MFLQKYQKKCEVGIPVSIRESKNEAMSNLVFGIRIKHLFDTEKTFDENAMQVDAKIKSKSQSSSVFALQFLAELPMTLIDAVLLNTHDCYSDQLAKQTAKIMGYIGKTRDLGITNLTVIDIPVLYESYKIKNIIFVPPAVSYAHNIIGISTVNGKMTFSFHNMVRHYEIPSQNELDKSEVNLMNATECIRCLICENKTRLQISNRTNNVIKHYLTVLFNQLNYNS